MTVVYILLGLLALVVAVFVFYSLRGRKDAPTVLARQEEAGDPVTLLRDAAPDTAKPALRLDEFDPGETLVYMRQTPGTASTTPKGRTGAASSRAGARLIGLSGRHKGSTFPIPEGGLTIGRNAACHIVLADPRVSQRHAWVGDVEGKITLRDLKSTNGTFLNAHLTNPVSEAALRSGDTLFFGGHQGDQFLFMAEPQAPAARKP